MSELVVLVPTRSRPQNVKAIVEAWHETGAFGVADLYFIIDGDDMEHQEYLREIRVDPAANVVILPDWRPLVPKLNRTAVEFTHHPAIAFMGDDHIPRTRMWAHMLVEDHQARGHLIVYGQDGAQNEALPTWWSMSSRVVDRLGGMVPGDVQHLYCDNVVKTLGETAECLFYDERILIEHMHPIFGKGPNDAQYARVNRPEQYLRDRAAFQAYVKDGLERDATILRSLGG